MYEFKHRVTRRRGWIYIMLVVGMTSFPGSLFAQPTAQDLYQIITQTDPFEQWEQFPEATGTINSSPPHGPLGQVFINNSVEQAIPNFTGRLPEGSIIVKKSFNADMAESGDSITVMWKVAGFDPDNHDWFWSMFTFDGAVLAEGKIGGCIGCHGSVRDNDFIFLHHFATMRGSPVLGSSNDNGSGIQRLNWTNTNAAPNQFLALAFDLYTGAFVNRGPGGSIWFPFSSSASSGDIDLGFTGGYLVSLGTQYSGNTLFFETRALIQTAGTPHTPLNVQAVVNSGVVLDVNWKPDLFGSAATWAIVYDLDNSQWISVGGPLGDRVWQYVLFGSTEHITGTMQITVPSSGNYFVFLAHMGWSGARLGGFSADSVNVP